MESKQHIMQSNRLSFIDLARTLAAIFMILIHITDFLSTQEVQLTWLGKLIALLGETPAAPAFMFAMGVSFALTYKNSNPTGKLIRGAKIIYQGYLLNFLRLFIPFIVVSALSYYGLLSYIDEGGNFKNELINNLLVVDILQFAGLAYIFLLLLSVYNLNRIAILIPLIVIITFISPYLWGMQLEFPYINRVLDLLWGDNGELVSFPFFPWIIYPLTGMICGLRYKTAQANLTEVIKKDMYYGVILFVIGGIIAYTDPNYHFGDYWRTGPGGLFLYTGFLLIWIFLCYMLSNKLPRLISSICYFTSKNITTFYFIQWIIISSLIAVLGENKISMDITLSLIISVLIATYLGTYLITTRFKKQL